MSKVYQNEVKEMSQGIIESLIETNFFVEQEIENVSVAVEYLREQLTELYINGGLSYQNIFSDEVFKNLLNGIITTCHFKNLQEKGYVNSYSDEDTEEIWYLTTDGKKLAEEIKLKQGLIAQPEMVEQKLTV